MYPVERKNNSSSFTYKNSQGGGHSKGSKGITHELVQEYLCKLNKFSFKVYGKTIDLKIVNAFDEWHVFDPNDNNRKAYIDCCLELDPNSEWHNVLGPRIGFEVTDTHKTGYRKKKLLEELGIFVFEIVTIKDWHIPNDIKPKKEDIYKLRARIKGYLNSTQHANILSQPSFI